MVALSYLELNEESLILPRECGPWFPMPASAGVLLDVTVSERIPLTSTRWFISYPLCGLTFASFAGGGGWSWRSDYSHTVWQALVCSLMDVLLLSCKSSILWDGTSDEPLDVVVGWWMHTFSLSGFTSDWWLDERLITHKHIGNLARVWFGCIGKLPSTVVTASAVHQLSFHAVKRRAPSSTLGPSDHFKHQPTTKTSPRHHRINEQEHHQHIRMHRRKR